jgi:hypothetical protein
MTESAEQQNGIPEIMITVSQVIGGKRVQTAKIISFEMYMQARVSLADLAIKESLSELGHYARQHAAKRGPDHAG